MIDAAGWALPNQNKATSGQHRNHIHLGQRLGQRAAERMLDRLKENATPRIEEIQVELILRASSGPAPRL